MLHSGVLTYASYVIQLFAYLCRLHYTVVHLLMQVTLYCSVLTCASYVTR